MTGPMCVTCGTEFPDAAALEICPICADERQYVPVGGQAWTSRAALARSHRNGFHEEEPGLIGIATEPVFAIGQRALLVMTPHGNLLWDCLSLIDAATVRIIDGLGGLAAIAISHPHYYSAMAAWSAAFGGVPVWLHGADREWVMHGGDAVRFWSGDTKELLPGVTAIRAGGHFAGGTVLHWAAGAEGRGALLTGDILQVAPDLRSVSFLRSYPNMIPLSTSVVRRICRRIEPFAFDGIHGAFRGRTITRGAKAAVTRSAARYIDAIEGRGPADAEE